MANRKDEHVIYVKDLLFAVLYRWRAILIITIVLALALGGFRYVSLRNADPDNTEAQEALVDYEYQKQILALEITRLEDRIDTFSNYVANSPFMALNPHKVYIYELHIYLEPIQTNTGNGEVLTDPTDALLGAYRTMLLSNEALSNFSVAVGAEGMNMEFIVDATADLSANLLTVIVRQSDQENTEAVKLAMQEVLDEAKLSISEVMGTHKVAILGESVSLRNDTDLALIQSQKNEELVNLKKNLEARIADQSALVEPTPQPVTKQEILVPVIKTAALAAGIGLLVLIVLFMLFHLTRAKIYSRRTLADQTGLYILGCMPSAKKRCCIDRWLRKLEGRSVEAPEKQSALIAARVRNLSGTDCALLLTGTVGAEDRLPLLGGLEAANCAVIADGDLLRCPETVSALGSCTAVVLIAQCGKTTYASVLESIAQAEVMGKPVIGCVLIDG